MRMIVLLLVGVLAVPFAYANEPPSEASIRELLELTNSKKMLDGIYDQIQANVGRVAEQALAGKEQSTEQRAIMDDMREKMIAMLRKDLSWESLAPTLIDVYRKTFTQDEIQGMVDFYKSPSGRAVITKMPAVMQASMEATQGRMVAFAPKIKELVEETVERLKATESSKPKAGKK